MHKCARYEVSVINMWLEGLSTDNANANDDDDAGQMPNEPINL